MGLLSAHAQDEEPIVSQPAGTLKTMSTYSFSYFYDSVWEMLDGEYQDGVATQLVYAEDGKTVYIKNPITHLPLGTWIKGTIEDGKLVIDTPQTIGVTESSENAGTKNVWTVNRMKTEQDEWDDDILVIDIDETKLTFNITDNGLEMEGGEGVALGLCLNGEFYEYGESEIKYNSFNAEKAVAPETAEFKPWSLQYGSPSFRVGHPIEVAVSGNDIYMKGIWADFPNLAVKGVIDGDKVRVPSDQYFGEFADGNVHYLLFMSNSYVKEDTYIKLHKTTSEDLVFDYDRADNSLALVNTEFNIMVRRGNTDGFETTEPEEIMLNPTMRQNTPYVNPLPPTYYDNFYTVFENNGNPFVMLEFSVKPFDENGNVLGAENITYSVWADNFKVTFSADKAPNYENLPEATDELPLSFVNKWGMANAGDNIFTRRRIQVFDTFLDKIGVQVNFTDPTTKQKYSSKIAYYYPNTQETTIEDDPTGIDNVTKDRKVVSKAYYNLSGARVTESFKGLCIEKVTFSDGTTTTIKTVK